MLTFADPLHRAEQCFGDSEAIVDGARRLSYAELATRCRRLAGAVSRATERGDRVAVLGANSHRVLEAWLAVPCAGRVVVPLGTRLCEAELAEVLKDSGAKLLLTDRPREQLGSLTGLVDRTIGLADEYEDWIGDAPEFQLGAGVAEDDVAGLFYTGGTTGRPKGVMLTHRAKIADTLHLQACVRLSSDDRWLVLGPMYHASGTFQALLSTWLGATQILMPGFDAASALDHVEKECATIAFGVPIMLSQLADEQRRRPRDVRSLRLMGFGAAPANTPLLRRFHDAFPGTELVSMYGATELGPMGTTLEHMERWIDSERARSAGRPVPGVRMRILDPQGREQAPGEVGEVVARGPNIMAGYWNAPEATREVLRDGWFHTGDLGYFDATGCLYLVDRSKDMIVSGGENVYSIEVEEALSRHPEVLECAVFAVPDEKWGEAVQAAVVPCGGTSPSEEELRGHCRRHLAGYKVPRRIEIRSEPLPRSAAGKLLKRDLRTPFWQGRDRDIA